MIDSIYQEGTDSSLDDLVRRVPAAGPAPGKFTLTGLGSAVTRGAVGGAVAEAIGSAADVVGAFGQVLGATDGSSQGMFSTGTAKENQQAIEARNKMVYDNIDYSSAGGDAYRQRAKDLMPDPNTTHESEQIVAGVGKSLVKAVGYAVTLGPAAPLAFGMDEGLTEADKLKQQGVDLGTRTKAGLVTGAIAGASLVVPVAAPGRAAATTGLVVASGPGGFMAQTATNRAILEHAGYKDIANQYDPFDPVGLALSVAVPGVFGYLGYRSGVTTAAPNIKLRHIAENMESGGRDFDASGAVLTSGKGAKGRMQVLDSTNKDPGYGVRPAADDSLKERARVGGDYLDAMHKLYGSEDKALAAYNAGPGALDAALAKAVKDGGDWLKNLPTETQKYVANGVKKLGADRTGAAVRGAIANDPDLVPAARVNQVRDAMETARLVADSDIAGLNAHADAVARAHDQLAAGQRVDVSDLVQARTLDLDRLQAAQTKIAEPWIAAAGERPAGMGRDGQVFVGDRPEPVKFMVVEADSLTPQIGKADNQYRDRNRVASTMQIQRIAADLQFGRLGEAPTMGEGAPTLAQDHQIVGGNGRIAAVRQAYENGGAGKYRAQLEARAAEFGIDAAHIQGMKKPVLVRRFENPIDVRGAAILSNEGGGLRMSALEQSKVDAERMPSMRDLELPENGDLSAPSARTFIRQWLSQMPPDQQAALVGADGRLSAEGVTRARNGLLYKAYGDSPTLARLVESVDDAQRNVANALIKAAPRVAEVREMIAAGALRDLDIQPQILEAVEKFAELRASGMKVDDFIAQADMFGQGISPEAVALMRFMEQNKRSTKALTNAITGYYDAVREIGHPDQSSMFESAVPTRGEILGSVLGVDPIPAPVSAGRAKRETTPELEQLEPGAREKLLEMYDTAENQKPAFDAAMDRLAQDSGATVKVGKLKKLGRAVEKINDDYAGVPTRLKDILRSTLEVSDTASAMKAIAAVFERFEVLPEGRRNLLDASVNPVDGYRDAKFNVRVGDAIAEIQISVPELLAAKHTAHDLYKERRTIEGKFEGKEIPAEVQAKIDALNAKMREIYEPAWERVSSTKNLNAASETGAPLRRAESAENLRGGSESQQTENGTPGQSGKSETGNPSTSKSSALGPNDGSSIETSTPIIGDTPISSNALDVQVAEIQARMPDLMVQLDGMDAPVPAGELLASMREQADIEGKEAGLIQVAANCFLSSL